LLATTSRLGLGRLIAAVSWAELPPRYRDDVRATAATGEEMSGSLAEYGVGNRSMSEAAALRSLDDKPLIVLTATVGNSEGWMADQNKLAELSTNSLHRLEAGASHASFVDDPVHAAAVTRAIHDVVVSLRTGAPLTHR